MFRIETEYPIAFDSPDHIKPWGTKRDNHSDTRFILNSLNHINKTPARVMDLGCGGGLIKEWLSYTECAIGLEGSDYSLKNNRAEWPELANKNLFTCDVSRPYQVYYNDEKYKCNMISAWEVIEHIHPDRLDVFFDNVWNHLDEGGIFLGSASDVPDSPEGLELHLSAFSQEKWENELIPLDKFEVISYPFDAYVRYGCSFYFCIRKRDNERQLKSLF